MLTLAAIAGIEIDDIEVVTSKDDTLIVPKVMHVFCLGKRVEADLATESIFIDCDFQTEITLTGCILVRCSFMAQDLTTLKKCIVDGGDYRDISVADSHFIHAPRIHCYRGYEDIDVRLAYLFDESVVLLSGGGDYIYLWNSEEPIDSSRILFVWETTRNSGEISFAQIDESTAVCVDGNKYSLSMDKRGYITVSAMGEVAGFEFSVRTDCTNFTLDKRDAEEFV